MKPVAKTYAPGFFLELVRLHHFPPMFEPQPVPKPRVDMHEVSTRSRQTALARGHTGTILGISRKADEQIKTMAFNARVRP